MQAWFTHDQSPSRAGQVVPLLLLGEAKQFTWELTGCHIEAICELPAGTGLARILQAWSAAGDSEGGEHRSVLGRHGTAGGFGCGHGAHQERSLPVASLSPCWEGREQSVSQNRAPAAPVRRRSSHRPSNGAVCSGTTPSRVGLMRRETLLLNRP